MRAKLFERYYKLGFDHAIFKGKLGLKKPTKGIKRFYLGLIFILVVLSLIFF